MKNQAIAKIFIGGDDWILSGDAKLVQDYIDDLYERGCLLDKNVEFDKCKYGDKCEYCESLRAEGDMEECPVLVTLVSHEENLTEKECGEMLEDYREDMPWAEVINLF